MITEKDETGLGAWDSYASLCINDAVNSIFNGAQEFSQKKRQWYRDNIDFKKKASKVTRLSCFFLFLAGVILPLIAATSDIAPTKLLITQFGVVSLVIAGLGLALDRIFGWSSGWVRYISTLFEMEERTWNFTRDWSDYILKHDNKLTKKDMEILYKKASEFEVEITRLRNDETKQWIAEFNHGIALLNDLIRSQREETEQIDAQQKDSHQEKPGAIEVDFLYKDGPVPLNISMDDGEEIDFKGYSWSSNNQLTPGIHTINVHTIGKDAPVISKSVTVGSGEIKHVEISVP